MEVIRGYEKNTIHVFHVSFAHNSGTSWFPVTVTETH